MIETVLFVAISVQELRRLMVHRPADASFRGHWSFWRRHHQAEAKRAHYKNAAPNYQS